MSEPATLRVHDARPDHPETMLTTREAAERLGVHERTVRRAITRGAIPALKQDGGYYIAATALARVEPHQPVARLVAAPPSDGMAPLPTPLAPFIGRQSELAAVVALLADPTVRLLPLTGPGGIGKTRLAIAAASRVQDDFPDGVVFVSLAVIAREGLVLPAVAEALGLKESRLENLQTRVRAVLYSRRLLLFLDNVEHLPGAAPLLSQLLVDAPAVTALVTSRAPLHISGEREWPVPPLGLPNMRVAVSPEALLASDAGRLFVERARAIDPTFVLEENTAGAVAEICVRLDGLPLAIELATARTKVLPPGVLLERLTPALPWLTSGPRDLPQRQRTLRQAIAWSYDLLSTDQQTLFRHLAVFAGGFDLEAATEIAECTLRRGEEDSDALSAVDLVGALLDQSLIFRQGELHGRPRFSMLETIREFGLERLVAHGEEPSARAAHAQLVLDRAQALRIPAALATAQEPLDRLAVEDANVRLALAWLDDAGPAIDFVRLAAALLGYWYALSRFREGREWLERALAKSEAVPALDRARVMIGLGRLAAFQGDRAAAEPLFTVGIPLLRATADPLEIAAALIWRGAMANHTGDYTMAECLLEEAQALAATANDPGLRSAAAGNVLSNLGVAARGQGNLELATQRHEAALARYQEHGHGLGVSRAQRDLGDVARDLGDFPLAVERYQRVLTRVGEQGDMRLVADALAGVACAAAAWGDMGPAARLFGAAEALRERVGTVILLPADLVAEQRGITTVRQTLREEHCAAFWAEGRALTRVEAKVEAGMVVLGGLQAGSKPAGPGTHTGMTRREREVLRLLVARRTDREIAEALFLSPRTVSSHVAAILGKLGVASRRDAARLAIAGGVV
jgi:excisionase family DNA binding protein